MIGDGVTVLAIVNLDSESGAAIQEKAKSQGVATIDYDRLTLGGSAEYYVSFDNTVVGELQGQGLADCLGDKNGEHRLPQRFAHRQQRHALRGGCAQRARRDEQLQAASASRPSRTGTTRRLRRSSSSSTPQADGKVDGVLAANDGLGGAAISILEGNGQAGKVPVTGQDATVEGLQNVLAGTQCMTVYKSATLEAGALADAAIALVNGEDAETTGTTEDSRERPRGPFDPARRRVAITKDNVGDVIDDGGQKAGGRLHRQSSPTLCAEAGICRDPPEADRSDTRARAARSARTARSRWTAQQISDPDAEYADP